MTTQNVPLYDIPLKQIDGTPAPLSTYKGKVLLLVNVASKCGLTPQYEGLEAMYKQYKDQGLEVLGFPANEFGAQEPGSNTEIGEFCRTTFGVQFPMFEKIVVKGEGIHPLYQTLIHDQPRAEFFGDDKFVKDLEGYGVKQAHPADVLWNFEKFLVDRHGKVVGRFAPNIAPDNANLVAAIEAELAKA